MKLRELISEAAPKAKKGLGLSLTKIKAYDNCKYRYYLQHIVKEKFDKADYNPKFFKIGQFAHKWIESKIKGTECKFNSTTMTDEEKQKTSGNCSKVFDNDYVKSILPKGEAERGFSLYIDPMESDGLRATGSAVRSADFSGSIDFFAKIGSELHLVDWKTGSKKGKDDDTFMQLMLYAKAMQKLEGGSKFILSYYYIDHDVISTREFTLDELNAKINALVKKATSIPSQDNPNLFPPSPGKVCKYCPYSKVRSSDNKVVCNFVK